MVQRRLSGLLAMRPDVHEAVFPAPTRVRLRQVLDLTPGDAPLTDFTAPSAAPALAEAEVIVSGWGCPPIDEAVLDAAPHLRAVVHAAGTVKGHVSLAVWKRGVLVSSAAAVNALPVAQYTLAVILLAGKQAFRMAREYGAYSDGRRALSEAVGNHGRTVGVIGASRIGRLVLPMLSTQGFRTLVSDPTLTPGQAADLTQDGGTALVDLDTLLRSSDVVSLHAPLLPTTVGLLDDRRLTLLRDGATLVNTARGALLERLAAGRPLAGLVHSHDLDLIA